MNILVSVFRAYALASGQVVNCIKYFIYSGAMSTACLNILSSLSSFNAGPPSFMYLRAPIFKGKPRAKFLLPIANKIILKLASWKGYLLSFAGRVESVKSSIQSMIIHSMSIYDWSVFLLREIEKISRNFIWSGNVLSKKSITVAWKKICKPISEGGLDIRSLLDLNASSNLKLAWDSFNSDKDWAVLSRSRVLCNNNFIKHHIYSLIWSSIEAEIPVVQDNSSWLLGNGNSINF
ncbi:unnamed protein product [Vicia faba]|uniref:Uncharacterized protein n=1 Tax=Vicia faba TaxID=3906 RepID=A0AAV0Z4K6_VICFA|nr:unnamed protein product [Vicia faba]